MPPLGRVPLAERTVPHLLARARAFGGERPFLVAPDGRVAWTYDGFLAAVQAAAFRLAARFPPGSRVGLIAAPDPDALVLRYALSWAGLTEVAIHRDHRGAVLARMVSLARPAAIVADPAERAVVAACGAAVPLLDPAELLYPDGPALPARPAEPAAASRILFTSGTTGRSKAVEIPHAYEVHVGERHVGLIDIGPGDRWFYATPLAHIDAVYIVSILLHTGAALVLSPRFSASAFWGEVEAAGATHLCHVGAILAILLEGDGPARPTPLRWAVGGGASAARIARFEARFGVKVIEAYAMTEAIACAFSPHAGQRPGTMGRAVPGYEIAVAGAEGGRAPTGTAGEILVRSAEPFGLFSGYFGDPEATARAMRGGWFHTGDLGRLDADGYLTFLGRLGDAIRVRGENVSGLELEEAVEAHPLVAAAAAVPTPAPLGGDDILLHVEPVAGADLAPDALVAWLGPRVARFMLPRHVRLWPRLPRTATEKVARRELPRQVDAATWSRP